MTIQGDRDRESETGEDTPEPDIVPADAARGAQTIPNPQAQTGAITPPIAGWGETLPGSERPHDEPAGDETTE